MVFLVVSHDSIRRCLSVGPSVHLSVRLLVNNAFVSAGREELANDLFCVYKLVLNSEHLKSIKPTSYLSWVSLTLSFYLRIAIKKYALSRRNSAPANFIAY